MEADLEVRGRCSVVEAAEEGCHAMHDSTGASSINEHWVPSHTVTPHCVHTSTLAQSSSIPGPVLMKPKVLYDRNLNGQWMRRECGEHMPK